MINKNAELDSKKRTADLIDKWTAYLRFSKGQCETSISLSRYVISMLARDLEVSLLDASTLELREVLCRYYDRVEPSTLNQYRSIIVSFYKYLFIEGIIKVNPAIGIPRRKVPYKLPKFIEQSSIDKIISHDFDTSNYIEFQQKCIFELMLLAGMKCGEIAQLTKYNFVLCIDGISYIPCNNKKPRIIPNELIKNSSLKEYILVQPVDCIDLFPNYTSTRQIRDMVRFFMVKYCDLYNITPMTLRHSFAISMINHGVRDIFVANLLGTKILHCQSIYKYANIDIIKREYSTYFNRK